MEYVYLNAEIIGGIPMLIPREGWKPNENLNAYECEWISLLRNKEQSFLTDNQLSIWLSDKNPGCEKTLFYPLPFPYKFREGNFSWNELGANDNLKSKGPYLDIEAASIETNFLPNETTRVLKGGGWKIRERSCVLENLSLLEWSLNIDNFDIVYESYLPVEFTKKDKIILGTIKGQVYLILGLAEDLELETKITENSIRVKVRNTSDNQKVHLIYSCGYSLDEILKNFDKAKVNPDLIFEGSLLKWDVFFKKVVPHFDCSNKGLEKLYYYQAYVTRANIFDIPYEPFTYLYTCPWKTGAIWQWSWNTPMNSICERWLNDKSIGMGGINLMKANGGALNLGTYLHPLEKVTELRNPLEYFKAINMAEEKLPNDFKLQTFTTLPYSTPNGMFGIWELFLSSGDLNYLEGIFDEFVEAERNFSASESEIGLTPSYFIDEYDFSIRHKPFNKYFKKGDTNSMYRWDKPYYAIDYNSYMYHLREIIMKSAILLKKEDFDFDSMKRRMKKTKYAINKYMWDERTGFYYDIDPDTLKYSNVKSIAAFSTLYSGVADGNQAKRLTSHLLDPNEFNTPYPCPSVSIDTPDFDPSIITYGGDSLMTSGIWTTVEGLIRYGYKEIAKEYIWKTIEMVTLEGPSSSYSYNSITGKYNQEKHTLASQCNILTDLICKYIIGIIPRENDKLEINPIALDNLKLKYFSFGPYIYKNREVSIDWDMKRYRLKVDGKEFLFKEIPQEVFIELP